MPDPIIDREALIEAAAKAAFIRHGDRADRWGTADADSKAGFREDTARTLPVIAAAILAPMRARHRLCQCAYCDERGRRVCAGCSGRWPCADSAVLDAIEAAVKGGE